MKTAIGYARLSVEKENSVSIEYQTEAIEKLAQQHSLRLIGVEKDLRSGKNLKSRPGIQRLIEAVKTRSVDCILVFKSDRLSRDGLDSLMLEGLFQRMGMSYISASEGILIGGSFEDSFMKYLRAGLNERERSLHSYRLKTALAKRKSAGQRLGSQPRYGQMVLNRELIDNPREIVLINRMKQLKTAGHSTRSISAILTSEGHQTRKGTCFSHNQVAVILRVA